ncbi:hypothetical protein CR513_35557, partial [Mucuna pruriens]
VIPESIYHANRVANVGPSLDVIIVENQCIQRILVGNSIQSQTTVKENKWRRLAFQASKGENLEQKDEYESLSFTKEQLEPFTKQNPKAHGSLILELLTYDKLFQEMRSWRRISSAKENVNLQSIIFPLNLLNLIKNLLPPYTKWKKMVCRLAFIDDHTRLTWVYLVTTKFQVGNIFQKKIHMM